MSASSFNPHGGESPKDRLNSLFATIRRDNGKEYPNTVIAELAETSAVYIGLCRSGQRTPSWQVARRIEAAFGLTEPYILEKDPPAVEAIDDQLRTYRKMVDGGVLPLAMRALHVETDEGRAAVQRAIERVLEMERAQREGGEHAEDPAPHDG